MNRSDQLHMTFWDHFTTLKCKSNNSFAIFPSSNIVHKCSSAAVVVMCVFVLVFPQGLLNLPSKRRRKSYWFALACSWGAQIPEQFGHLAPSGRVGVDARRAIRVDPHKCSLRLSKCRGFRCHPCRNGLEPATMMNKHSENICEKPF